jgi:hypothetical protein
LDAAECPQRPECVLKVRRAVDEDAALRDRLLHRRLDLVDVQQVGCFVDVVDDVVNGAREAVDVLAVEGCDVLRVEQLERLARVAIALRLEFFDA